jgi:hypothetical protein
VADPDETCELRRGAASSCKHSVIKSFRRMLVEKGSILGLKNVPERHPVLGMSLGCTA